MEPISHDALVTMLKHQINVYGGIAAVCRVSNVARDDLEAVLEGRVYARPSLLAKIAYGLSRDWRMIVARYALWQFETVTRKEALERKQGIKKLHDERPPYAFEVRAAARQIITDNPALPAESLAHQISQGLFLDMQQTLDMIRQIRESKTGDYQFE